MAGQDYEEKRDFVRMRIETQVTYTIKGNSGITHHGDSQDLSATGLYMTTDYALSVGDIIDIIMNPSGERLPPFTAQGKVIRCVTDENDANLFHVSAELSQI
ncbi:MAG: PilZ domain-containing protein [Gammaproteobacteria bacterium]|nr:PilZ domain-containing protein [Gammaproteobacteria bacterium]